MTRNCIVKVGLYLFREYCVVFETYDSFSKITRLSPNYFKKHVHRSYFRLTQSKHLPVKEDRGQQESSQTGKTCQTGMVADKQVCPEIHITPQRTSGVADRTRHRMGRVWFVTVLEKRKTKNQIPERSSILWNRF